MNRQRTFGTALTALMAAAVIMTGPRTAHAMLTPVIDETVYLTQDIVNEITGVLETKQILAIDVTIFGPDAVTATEAERISADPLFNFVTPTTGEYTFFYGLLNLDERVIDPVTFRSVILRTPNGSIVDNALSIKGFDGVDPATATTTVEGINPAVGVFYDGTDLLGLDLQPGDVTYLTLTSEWAPNPALKNAWLLRTSQGNLNFNVTGPDDDPVADVPEPGTLLLVGLSVLGFVWAQRATGKEKAVTS